MLEKLLDFLEGLGLNTTRWRWRLYRARQKVEQKRTGGVAPASLSWWRYPHKFCLKCGALADRDARECRSCGARMPSMLGYRLFRLVGVITPDTGAPITYGFIAMIVAVFILGILMQGPSALMAPNSITAIILGALPMTGWPGLWDAWRLFGFGLAHFGLIHIGFNGFALSQIGPLLEEQTGRARYFAAITFSQFTAAAVSIVWYSARYGGGGLTAGASGWLFGLIGFGIAYFHLMGSHGAMYKGFLMRWAMYGLVFGLLIGANNAAHVGGLLGGAAVAFIPEPHPRRSPLWKPLWIAATWICAVIWLITLVFLGLSVVFNWGAGQ